MVIIEIDMKYNKLPHWLRGGAIGIMIAIISFALTNLCEYIIIVPGYSGLGFECFPFAVPWFPLWHFSAITSAPAVVYFLLGILIWFALGTVFGSIFGFFKNRVKK